MEYYKYRRALCCLIFGALGFIQIGFAGVQPNFNDPAVQAAIALQYNQTAGKLQWLLTGGSSAGYDARYPVAAITKPLGSVNSIGNWELYLDPAGKPATKTSADFKFAPFKDEVSDVSAKFKARDVAGALGRFANKVLTPLAVGFAIFDLARELGFWVSRNPDGTLKVEKDGQGDIDGRGCRIRGFDGVEYDADTCKDAADIVVSNSAPWGVSNPRCTVDYPAISPCLVDSTAFGKNQVLSPTYYIKSFPPPARIPSSQEELEDKIANEPNWPPTSKLIPALRDALKSGEQVKPDPTTITGTGPANSPSPAPTVKDSPDATTSTSLTNNYNYAGDTITNTTTSTTNNYSKVNNTTTTTTTTNVPEPEPPKDFCADFPERIGCLGIDTPTVDIPKKEKNVTYAAEDLFGGGSCPPPKTATYMGNQLTFSFQPTCDALQNYIRYMIISAALFAAYLMIVKSLKG